MRNLISALSDIEKNTFLMRDFLNPQNVKEINVKKVKKYFDIGKRRTHWMINPWKRLQFYERKKSISLPLIKLYERNFRLTAVRIISAQLPPFLLGCLRIAVSLEVLDMLNGLMVSTHLCG